MSSGIGGLKLYCKHVSKRHVHCNRYVVIDIDLGETPGEAIECGNHDWGIVDGEIRCPEHND